MLNPVALHTERVDGAHARRAMLFLHGILGSGPNLRTLARKFVEARPDWSVVLVDLRGHGRSPKGTPGPSLAAAAADVAALAAAPEHAALPIAALLGHSFGGKVALEVARRAFRTPEERFADGEPAGVDRLAQTLEHVVTVDSVPGERVFAEGSRSTVAVVEHLEGLTASFPTREAFVDAVAAAGMDRPTGHWLAMSLVAAEGGLRFGLDMPEIRALLESYRDTDLWSFLDAPPVAVHLVIGDRSTVYSADDRARAARLAAGPTAAPPPGVTVDVLPAGHWVHVDDARGLRNVLLQRLSDDR